ncbi:MAG: hypothetical protein ACNI3A_00420 [Desulfovibrio sp.]|uniref:hypothetical protein n=1 Tax=Desulfovibrio sp. 7SRBS1 TaxID=3378064 RepID=UPI003B3D5A97
MITVDGRQMDLHIENFENLEQLLVKVVEGDALQDRVVTDVYVNNEAFSEIYPHQAEDIESNAIESVEIKTMDSKEMAVNITRELYKVIRIMENGAKEVAELFRKADDSEGLDLFQDLLDVTRDFFGMVGVLRSEFSLDEHEILNNAVEELSNLFSEMVEVTENEDWILLSDLLEYEYIPAVVRWKNVVAKLREDLRDAN